MKFGLIMRAYAPFKVFGGPFLGDNRGPTTSSAVTSRVKSWVDFDPIAGTVGSPHAKSEASSVVVIPYTRTARPMTRVSIAKRGPNSIYFNLHASGANPLLPAPDIDMHLSISASVSASHLNIIAELRGDQFPNCEVMLQDEGENRRMLFTYETDGAAHTGPGRLFGPGKRLMNSICKSFTLNAVGRFV